MTQSQDYIFCPLCGEHQWTVDKTRSSENGPLVEHKCGSCRKFIYVEVSTFAVMQSGLKVFYRELHSEEVFIDDYHINICHQPSHEFTCVRKDGNLILDLKHPVKFDWYKDKNVKDKIKKFLVFS
jgi:hypothetical protein